MNKKILWLILFVFSIVIALGFIIGIVTTIHITTSTQNGEMTKSNIETSIEKTNSVFKSADNLNILVIGDSIGAGVGDETSMGLGKGYALKLNDNSKSTEVINLSVPGAKTEDLLAVIQNTETDAFLIQSHMVMISIGGNDIKSLLDNEASTLSIDYEELLTQYLSDLKVILNAIKAKNADTQIVFIGLYNPYGDKVDMEKIELLLNMNYKTSLLVDSYSSSVYIPTYDLFKYHLDAYLTIDDFHPNAAGYSAIVDRIMSVVLSDEMRQ